MDFFGKFGLPAKLNTVLFLLTVLVLFVLTVWLKVPPTQTLFFGAGIIFVAIAVAVTGLVSLFKRKPPIQKPGIAPDAH